MAVLLSLATLGWSAATPDVSWQVNPATVNENAGTLSATLRVNPKASSPVTVAWATVDGTAKAGTDYVAASGTVVIPANSNGTSVSVTIVNDNLNTGDRTFGLTISSVTGGAVLGSPASVTVTIKEDDTKLPPATVIAAPVIAPTAGTYQQPVMASATCATAGVELRYRLDGNDPTASDPLLPAGGVSIDQPLTVAVRGFLATSPPGPVSTAAYAFSVAPVTADLAGGTYVGGRSVTLSSATPGAVIHYTLDGTAPTATSPVASGPIVLPGTTVLRAIAMRTGWTSSARFRATYTLVVPTPVLSPAGATFNAPFTAQATSSDPLATLRYTTNGTTPTATSPAWPAGGLAITQTTGVRVAAFRSGWQRSAVVRATYTMRVASLVATPPAGTYIGAQLVVLTSATPGAVIRYTLDGTAPTATSPIASGPIALPGSCTLRAISMLTGWSNSAAFRAAYVLRVPAPVLSPAGGAHPAWPLVTASADPLATIRYTLGATLPTASSPVFPAGGLQLNAPTTVNVLATRSGWATSLVTTAAYTRNLPPVPQPLSLTGDEDAVLAIQALANDSDSAVLAWAVQSQPANGSVAVVDAAAGRFTYTPTADFHGSDPFVLTVSDGLSTVPLTVGLTVRPVNDLPVAQPLAVVTAEDTPVALVPQASDVDGDLLTWTVVTGPAHGTLTAFTAGSATYAPSADWSGVENLVLQVSDGVATVQVAATVTVAAVNDAPVASAAAVTDEDVAVVVAPVASDADGDALVWSLVSGPARGTLGAVDPSTGAVLYTPTADSSGDDQFVLQVSDGTAPVQVVATVTVRAVNDPPVLAALEGTMTWFRDGDAPLAVTGTLTVSDADSATLSGATISIAANYQAGDSLVLTGALPSGITSAWNAGTLTLSGAASPASYQTALRRVAFTSSQAFPGTAARSIALTVDDGSAPSATVVRTLGVVTRSTAPWSEGFEGLAIGGDLHQLELQGLTRWHAWNATPGASALVSAQARTGGAGVAIAGATDLVKEYKGVNAGGWRYSAWQFIPTTFTGTSYFILLNTYRDTAGADGKNWSTQVKFTNSQVLPDFAGGSAAVVKGQWVELRVDIDLAADQHRFFYNGVQVFQRSWTGGTTGGGVRNLAAVDLYANNASPVYYDDISLTPIVPTISGGGSVAYVENAAPVAVMPALAIDGFGVAQLSGATAQLTGDLSQDVLSATVSGGISQSWNPATGTLTLSGNATPAAYQTVLRTVAFANVSDAPTAVARTVAFAVAAPTGTSNSVSAMVTVTAVNDAPIAQALSLSGDEDTVLAGQALASDVDGGALSWSLASQPANGSATVSASGAVSYQPNVDFVGTDSFALTVSDGNGGSATADVAVTVNPVDDAAVITVPTGGSATPESDLVLGAIQVADIDSPIVTVQVSVDAGTITLPGQPGAVAAASHTLTGTPAEVTAALVQTIWRAPSAAGPATLTVAGNGGTASVALTTLAAPSPIVVQPLAVTEWNGAPHGTHLAPTAAAFWRLDVVTGGRYHLWLRGAGATVPVAVDGTAVASVALPSSTGWSSSAEGVVATLDLSSGAHELRCGLPAGTILDLKLVAETPVVIGPSAPVIAGNGAVTVIDVQDCDSAHEAGGYSWLPTNDGGMIVQPNVDGGDAIGVVSPSSGLSYGVYFAQAGSYRVWVRGSGDTNSDSVFVGLDGAKPSAYVTGNWSSGQAWGSVDNNGNWIHLSVPTAGLHQLNIRMREDGTSIHQIALSAVPMWTPIAEALPVSARDGVSVADAANSFALEAESPTQLLPGQNGYAWNAGAVPGAVGSAMAAGPDIGGGWASLESNRAKSPVMTWFVQFAQAGTYDVWIRGTGPNSNGDSYHVGIGGDVSQSGDITLWQSGAALPWSWTNHRTNGTAPRIIVPAAGIYPINVWMREDGAVIDRLLIQPTGGAAPSAAGPAEAIRIPVVSGSG